MKLFALSDTLHIKAIPIKKELSKGIVIFSGDSILRKVLSSSLLPEYLLSKPSLFVLDYGGGMSHISYRATKSNQSKVYWQGIPVISSTLGSYDVSLLSLGLISDIELLNGSEGLMQGGGTLGGTIQLKSSFDEPDKISLSSNFGMFGNNGYKAVFSFNKNKLSSITRAIYNKGENDYHYIDNTQNPAVEAVQDQASTLGISFMQQVKYTITENQEVEAGYWHNQNQREIPFAIISSKTNENKTDSSHRLYASYTLKNEISFFNILSGYTQEILRYNNPVSEIYSVIAAEKYFNQALWKYHGNNKWAIEAQIQHTIDEAKTSNYLSKQKRSVTGFSIKGGSELFKDFSWEAIIRQDVVQNAFIPLQANGILQWKKEQGFHQHRIYLMGGRVYNYPSMNDLFWLPGGNSALKPEEGLQASINKESVVELNKRTKVQLKSSLYIQDIKNHIIWLPGATSLFEAQNIGRMYINGKESSLEVHHTYKPNQYLLYQFHLSQNSSLDKSDKNNPSYNKQTLYIPKWQINNMMGLGFGNTAITLQYQWVSKRYATTDNSRILPDYHLFHLHTTQKITYNAHHCFDLGFKINNILNKSYQTIEWYPMRGRYAEITVKYSWH